MTSLGKRKQEFSIRFCYDMNSSVNAHFLKTTYTFKSEVSYVPSYIPSYVTYYEFFSQCSFPKDDLYLHK